ncbi:hypothetical protein EVAR_82395_1 [Eumeta japonica]|uniref:Uncharacterized protein n=1 Tax=Eumeta variegata TaxID=151549 RepID=A0A4C1UAV4_EUMVA|nr:hypothetical protein EVAR_82395_1 [Eumeta japonica]
MKKNKANNNKFCTSADDGKCKYSQGCTLWIQTDHLDLWRMAMLLARLVTTLVLCVSPRNEGQGYLYVFADVASGGLLRYLAFDAFKNKFSPTFAIYFESVTMQLL